MIAENVLYDRDVVLGYGQSNMGCYGSLISAWPQRERYDRNVGIATTFMYGYGNLANGWGDGSMLEASDVHNQNGHGMLMLSIAARMRDAGLRPSIAVQWHGGGSSTECLADMTTVAPWFATRYSQIIKPRSVCLVWSQGENETLYGTGAIWRADTEASIAAVRAALGMPTLRVFIIGIPITYTPEPAGSYTYRTEVRAAQAALVAADPYAVLIDPITVTSVIDGIHHDRDTHDRVAKMFVSKRLAA
jgi:hypothetical protein